MCLCSKIYVYACVYVLKYGGCYVVNVVGGFKYKMDGLSSNLRRRPLQVAVAGLLSELGYEHAEKMAHETLIEVVQSSKFVLTFCNFMYLCDTLVNCWRMYR